MQFKKNFKIDSRITCRNIKQRTGYIAGICLLLILLSSCSPIMQSMVDVVLNPYHTVVIEFLGDSIVIAEYAIKTIDDQEEEKNKRNSILNDNTNFMFREDKIKYAHQIFYNYKEERSMPYRLYLSMQSGDIAYLKITQSGEGEMTINVYDDGDLTQTYTNDNKAHIPMYLHYSF